MTRLLLVRHGETEWNKIHRIQGQSDVPLNETGEAQALAVGRALAAEKEIAAVWASDLQRAWKTAEAITAHHPDLTIQAEPRMRELYFGDWEGLYWQKLSDEDARLAEKWRQDASKVTPPAGESMIEMAERVGQVMADVCAQYPEETVVIAAHGGSIRAMIAVAIQCPLSMAWRFGTDNTSIAELYIFPEGPFLKRLNDTRHLD